MDRPEQHQLFSAWIDEHIAIVHRTVNGFAQGDDRNDLMQEVLLALWKAVPLFRSQSKPSTFIYRVAHNAALTWKRTQGNYQRKLEEYESQAMVQSASNEAAPDVVENLYRAIRQLPPLDRSLALLFLDDLSYREIAEIHGLSENNVGVRISRLKQKLAQLLKENSREY